MWERRDLKDRAKDLLRGNYWLCFLVSLVLLFAGGSHNGGSGGGGNSRFAQDLGEGNPRMALMILMGMIVVGIVFIVLRIFVGYALEIGGRKFFVKGADTREVTLDHLGDGFRNNYWNGLKALFWRDILLFLWTLLLIIPGIIKSYAYRFVPYILAENPDMDGNRALEISNEMTKGHKFSIFVLDLSFLGWYLLGVLALLIGTLFVHPYVDATNAELYMVLRKNALDQGICSPDELNIVTVE